MFNCVPFAGTFFVTSFVTSGEGVKLQLTSACTGMVRLRSSSRKSSLRAGSRDGAKQLCGFRLSRQLPRERTATMSQAASQKPLRAARRLIKAASSTPSQGDGLGRRLIVEIETHDSRGDCSKAASAQLVRGSVCGPLKRAMVRRVRMSSSAAGPRRGGQSKATGSGIRRIGPKGINGIGCPTPYWPVRAFALACPSSANSSPRRAGCSRVQGAGPSLRGPAPCTRINALRCIHEFTFIDIQSVASQHGLTDQQSHPWSATHHLALPFEAVLAFVFS